MGNHGCANGTLDDTKYSSPVPLIGLYISFATSVCVILMACDIISGFCSRKPWLPCRFFSLSSVTLTLLSVVAKVPVDLTTAMPSAQDQLSKLTGTTFICVSMGVLMPSIGVNRETESLTNLIAISIMVITVVVNLCMQIQTGVIYMFHEEHIVIMCFMLALLVVLCFIKWGFTSPINTLIDRNKDILITCNQGTLLQRLKFCYLYSYNTNPQLLLCRNPHCTTIGILCFLSLVIVIRAAFRSLVFEERKFCRGTSDYGLSMWMIIVTQILGIILGTLCTSFRYLSMVFHIIWNLNLGCIRANLFRHSSILAGGIRTICLNVLKVLVLIAIILMFVLILFPFALLPTLFRIWRQGGCRGGGTEEIEKLTRLCRSDEWTYRKAVADMYKKMEVSRDESLDHLSQLLSKTPPSQELQGMELKDQVYPTERIKVSLLSVVILVEIALVSLPYTLTKSLLQVTREVYEILHFIDFRISSNRHKTRLANEVWNSHQAFQILESSIKPQSDINQALAIIQEIRKESFSSNYRDDADLEVELIIAFINHRGYSTVEDLYGYIEQLLVDMLHLFFAQVPTVIYNEVRESPSEECEERLSLALKLICRVKSLDALVQWSFPTGSNISRFIETEALQSPIEV